MKTHLSLITLLSSLGAVSHALPFTIVPQGTLPTTVSAGGTATASYTVTNNTGSQRSNNYVKYLPPNVTQVTSGAGVCGSTFTLAAHGQAGDSCTLSLTISGAVNGQAPQNNQHLFVCFPGGTSCAGTAFPLNVALSQGGGTPHSMVAGQYYNGTASYPLLAINTSGSTWSYVLDSSATPPSLPANFVNQGEFSGVNCSGTLCAAAGQYADTSGKQAPMLAVSTTGGSRWVYKIDDTNPPTNFFDNGVFLSVNCQASFCIAGGQYSTGSRGPGFPLLAVGTQGGSQWSYAIDATPASLPDQYGQFGGLTSVSCNASLCMAAGSYENTTPKEYPLLAVGTQGGTHWTYAIDDLGPLPSDFNDGGNLNGVSCSEQVCIAAGSYSTLTPNLTYPLIARSAPPGSTPTYTLTSSGPLPASFGGSYLNFAAASCDGQLCIAAGTYYALNGIQYPLLALSSDGGVNWSYPVDKNNLPFHFDSNGSLASASCSGQNCVAGGGYADVSFNFYPLLISSQDGGQTWSYRIDQSTAPLHTNNGFFNAVSCEGQSCLASGFNAVSFGPRTPFLAVSQDGGFTWTYEIDNTPSTLPPDFAINGTFNGAYSTGP
jgi:hypothetical protein